MLTKTKTFNCVEMKNRVQAEILAEYERQKDKFASFAEFLKTTESEWERRMREKMTRTP